MDTLKDTIKKYYKIIVKTLLFIAACCLVIFLLPRSAKFKYEYTKGHPWRYGALISGFDFPVLKTVDELKDEKDSILKNFRPYFIYDSLPVKTAVEKFRDAFSEQFPDLKTEFQFLKSSTFKGIPVNIALRNHISSSVSKIHNKGVIILPDVFIDVSNTNFEFNLIKGNYSEICDISEVYTAKNAYQLLQSNLIKFIEDSVRVPHTLTSQDVNEFISRLQLNRFIEPNVIYDPKRSEMERNELINHISASSGAIKMGQLIIAKGEIIDSHKIKIIDSYKEAYESRMGNTSGYTQILLGQILIVLAFFSGVYLFLYFFRKDVFESNKSISFILMLMCGMILLTRSSYSFYYIPILVIPYAILPIAIRTFFDSRLALFIHIITILLASFMTQNSYLFILLQISAGITSIFSLFRIERRSQIVNASIIITAVYCFLYTALYLWQEGDISKIDPFVYAKFGLNGAFLLLTYLLIYVFEKLFGFLSDVTLAELSNSNHPLISKLAELTPGTFHHSIQVGNLAIEAARKIGANPLLVYAGAMYHDIGKLESPSIFTENQLTGINPLDEIEYEQGAQLVIGHIENGIRLARKHKLPQQIIDFIATHQGTTKTKYFYNSFVNKYPDRIPDISLFSYPGPTPFTRETAILMMADAVEASSRSLTKFTDDQIDRLVESIINEQMEQGQFINAPITLKEISEIKEVFKRRLKIIYHSRIKYPELIKK